MKRTEKQIAEFMAYYDGTTDRKQALEELARVEGKSPAEIRKICEKYKSRAAAPAPEAPEETEEKPPERRGRKPKIEPVIKSRQQKQFEAITEKLPEAYPGQIYDDCDPDPEEIPVKKTEKLPEAYPGEIFNDYVPEEIPVKSGTARDCKELNVFAVLLLLQEVAKSCGNTEITETFASLDSGEARVRFRANDRKYELLFRGLSDD